MFASWKREVEISNVFVFLHMQAYECQTLIMLMKKGEYRVKDWLREKITHKTTPWSIAKVSIHPTWRGRRNTWRNCKEAVQSPISQEVFNSPGWKERRLWKVERSHMGRLHFKKRSDLEIPSCSGVSANGQKCHMFFGTSHKKDNEYHKTRVGADPSPW